MTTYVRLNQSGGGVGEDALAWVKANPDKVAKVAYANRDIVFQGVSNAHRFVEKTRGKQNIRYLKRGEIHVPLHNFTGPGTRIELPEVRNMAPYNNIDNCSKIHDIEFDRIFKMPLGKERSEAIRKADIEAIACYDKYPNDAGYTLARAGINNKIRLEDLSPTIFDKIMGADYRGVKQTGGGNLEDTFRAIQTVGRAGGINMDDPINVAKFIGVLGASPLLYAQYRGAKSMYDKYRSSKTKNKKEKIGNSLP